MSDTTGDERHGRKLEPLPKTVAGPSGPSSVGGGPTGKNYSIPPRPKPGRKPATDEPQTKRKAQNRESQRAFRARKAAKVHDLTDEVSTVKTQFEELQVRFAQLEARNAELESERDYWKSAHDQLKSGESATTTTTPYLNRFTSMPISQFNNVEDSVDMMMFPQDRQVTDEPLVGPCHRCKPELCACIEETLAGDHAQDPPFMEAVALPRRSGAAAMQGVKVQSLKADDSSELEIDFTSTYASAPPAQVDFLLEEEHQSCGFCTRPDNCLCRDESLRSGDTPVASVPVPAKGGPGSCADCQTNPQQRAWCQRIAQLRGEATPPMSRRNSTRSNSLNVMEPKVDSAIDKFSQTSSPLPGIRSVGCTETYKLFDGRVSMDVDHPDWRRLRPIQSTLQESRRDTVMSMEPGTYSAMEVDVGSILTTLQHSGQPLKPRPSDGPHASIVEKAEQLRRASNSPHTHSQTQAQTQNKLAAMSPISMDTTP
ncbi:hypothetical protein GQ44DRAFT_766842 [Phaeosphaeriaceae sp. PMI808]|nr:hypothetical protein GQ44DRAFT_766842 [Phaeosphaeriaceae sp. PMI808]